MKVKVMKKIFAALIIIAMFVPYVSGMINASIAADDDWREYAMQYNANPATTDVPTVDDNNTIYNWKSKVRSFQYFGYKMGSGVIAKWLFYDVRDGSKFQNINCIRSGNSQDDTYIMHDLYHLKEDKPDLYEELFNGPNNASADRNYQHVLWEIENFYLFDENDTPEQKQAKFDEYNAFIGATQAPFASDEMAKIQLYELDSGGKKVPEKVKNLTKNEVLVKTLQNETLLSFVKQTSRLSSEVPPIKILRMNDNGEAIGDASGKAIFDNLSDETNEYVGKIVSKFKTMDNSANYNAENINKYYNRNPELAKVQLRSDDTNADPTNNKSGSFFVKNKFNAEIKNVTVRLDGTTLSEGTYELRNASNENITGTIKSVLQNSASENEYEFYVYCDQLSTGTHNVEVELNVDYGFIISATLFEPVNKALDNNNKGCQYVININKDHRTDILKAGSQTDVPKYFDLALTKQIVNTTDIEKAAENGSEGDMYNRLKEIDAYSLNNGDTTTARYVMNKQPVRVEPGELVTYKITIYNEGQLDGFAEEITDYLPEELSLVEPKDIDGQPNINKKYGWTADTENSKIIRTSYLSSEGNPNSSKKIKAYSGLNFTNENKKEIYIQCKVTDQIENTTNGINKKIVDNRAEITKYGHYVKNDQDEDILIQANFPGNDRDSLQQTAVTHANTPAEMVADIENIINNLVGWNETNDDKAKTDYEDDDDIERIVIVQDSRVFDLALRKWIEKVDDKEYDRAPIQLAVYAGEELSDKVGTQHDLLRYAQKTLSMETLNYDNPKDAVELYPGAVVTYRIGIFNEGTISGYAEEITDYLPAYLEYIDNEQNRSYGWEATKYSDGRTYVKTNYFSRANGHEVDYAENSNIITYPLEAYTKRNVSHSDFAEAYRTIPIMCRVKEEAPNDSYLTNRAEITEYGYVNKQGEFVKANVEGIDRDSVQNTIINTLNLDTWYASKYLAIYNYQTPQISFPGEQDDDDFETVLVKVQNDNYSVRIKKVSQEDKSKTIEGAVFTLKLKTASSIFKTSDPTGVDGITSLLENVKISGVGEDQYIIKETSVPAPYKAYEDEISLTVAKKLVNGKFTLDTENTKVNGENVELDIQNNVITIIVPNPKNEFDLSLRKFISAVNGAKLEGDNSRAPKVDLSTLINGDPKKNGEKTATYTHTKEPVLVNPTDIVEYTFRIYNEGDIDAYASRVIDDVPEGVTMIAPEYNNDGTPLNKNAQYRWKMLREMTEADKNSNELANKEVLMYNDKLYIETEKPEEAVLISSDYLSMENGIRRMEEENKEENPNLIPAFDGKRLYYKGINVEYKVQQARTKDTIITNYAQISEHQSADGTPVTDRDSTPNVWKDNEDDQDIENLKVNWFDLALYKWVSSTIVTEDGKTKEYASGHTQDDKEKIVNVTIAKDKLEKTVVKFKWTIKVENQSPIPGYATELKDHIPAGLKFVEEDNKEFGWKLQEDGTVTTDYLKNTLLQQGETAEVTLVLTWVNGENNLGAKVNNAEISDDFNAYGAPDIDSTPNNFTGKPIEDDEDADEVRLNIKTGSGLIVEYIAIALGVLAILTTGTILVKKNVLDKEL